MTPTTPAAPLSLDLEKENALPAIIPRQNPYRSDLMHDEPSPSSRRGFPEWIGKSATPILWVSYFVVTYSCGLVDGWLGTLVAIALAPALVIGTVSLFGCFLAASMEGLDEEPDEGPGPTSEWP